MKEFTDEMIDRAQAGQRSALVKGEISRRMAIEEEEILSHALANFDNGLLSAEQARDCIAKLSALRTFARRLDKEIRKGNDAHSQLIVARPSNGGQR